MSADAVLTVVRYALDQGLSQERIESLIDTPVDSLGPKRKLPALVGPLLFAQMREEGVGAAPAIEVAQGAPLSFFCGLERAVAFAPSGRAGLQALARHFGVFHDGLIATLDETNSYTRFSIKFPGAEYDNGCCNEVVVSVLVRLMRCVLGAGGQPHEVHLRHDLNGRRHAYDSFFQAPIHCQSSDGSYSVVWNREDMVRDNPGYHAERFAAALGELAHAATLPRHCPQVAEYLELLSAATLCARSGQFNVESVAVLAGMGKRTAQRVAKRHGTSVGKLIEQARLKLLREQVLREPSTSAEHLSMLSGFSDARALRRAIKSWTGQPLSAFRTSPYAHRAGVMR